MRRVGFTGPTYCLSSDDLGCGVHIVRSKFREIVLIFGFFAGSFAGAVPVRAVELSYSLTGLVQHDDNIFKLPDAAKQAVHNDGAETMTGVRGAVAAAFDLGWLNLDATVGAGKYWFDNNSYLNNFGYDFALDADYRTERTGISFKSSHVRRLSSFDDVRNGVRNIQRLSKADVEASHAVIGDIRLVAGTGFAENRNSAPLIAVGDYRRYNFSAGVGYYSPAGSILAIEGRILRTDGLNDRVATFGGLPIVYRSNATDKTIGAHIFWQPSVIWQFDGRVGYTDHDDRSIANADFGGLTGRFSSSWLPLETLRFTTRFARSFESESGLFSNGIKTTNISADMSADVSERFNVQTSVGRYWRTYRFDIQADNPVVSRREHIDRIGAKMNFALIEKLGLSAEALHEKRASSVASYRYGDTRLGVSATLSLGKPANGRQ